MNIKLLNKSFFWMDDPEECPRPECETVSEYLVDGFHVEVKTYFDSCSGAEDTLSIPFIGYKADERDIQEDSFYEAVYREILRWEKDDGSYEPIEDAEHLFDIVEEGRLNEWW